MDEHRRPWPQRRLRDLTIAPDNVGGHDIVGDEPLTLRVELWRKLDRAPTAESGLLLTLGLQIVHVFVDGDEVKAAR